MYKFSEPNFSSYDENIKSSGHILMILTNFYGTQYCEQRKVIPIAKFSTH